MKLLASEVEADLRAAGPLRTRNVELDLCFTAVSTDSRGDVEGTLFVALQGERFDAHDFALLALGKGARGLLVASATWERWRGVQAACFAVEDPLSALQQLARASLRRHPTQVVAITGSNGKTTTKDLTLAALSSAGMVHGTQGNLNNHIGVPLTVLARSGEEAFLVAEVGANDFGEIEFLSKLLRPHVVVITNIGRAHLERFGSLQGVLRAKSEVFRGLRPGGTALLNADDPARAQLSLAAAGLRLRTCGFAMDADYRIEKTRALDSQSQELVVRGTPIHLQRPGRANAWNAAVAFATACELGAAPRAAADAMAACTFTRQRSCWLDLGDVRVLDDSYNANPDSMLQALTLLGEHPGRRVAVLGDMLELGEATESLHAELGAQVAASGVQLFFGFGPSMRHAIRAASRAGVAESRHFEECGTLVDALRQSVRPGDAILIKGSRGSHMERVVESLRAEVM
jgi:UDP-N-acetylmuramoyl-tripeptide--D-alanyl-D-alanine ligase